MTDKLVYWCLFCLFLLPACTAAQHQTRQKPQIIEEEVVQLPSVIAAEQKKKVFEFVHIAGENYPVPLRWRGKKLNVEPLQFQQLRQIPVRFTHQESKIYILKEACDAFVIMAEKALEEDVHLKVHSGYRSIYYQRKIFRQLMEKGRTWEDLVRYVAPPGYSEHMLGLVVDLYPSNWRFASTLSFQWLQKNGQLYGFEETYPEANPEGFAWEPWHWKYVGALPQQIQQ